MDHIDTILLTVVKTLFNGGPLSIGHVTSADIGNQLSSPAVTATQVVLTEVAFVLSVIFAGVIGYIALQRRALKFAAAGAVSGESVVESQPVSVIPGALRSRWTSILGHLDSARENDWKQAIVEADKLVDSALQQAGFSGDTFGDRLMNIQPGTLVSLDGLWWAHRIRNRVAHEMDYFLRYTEARQAVSYYEAVLSELQLL